MKYICYRRQSMGAALEGRFVRAYLVFDTILFHFYYNIYKKNNNKNLQNLSKYALMVTGIA